MASVVNTVSIAGSLQPTAELMHAQSEEALGRLKALVERILREETAG